MSELGFLEKLLNGADVEWVPLKEVFHLKNGYTPSRSNQTFWENGTVPWFTMSDIRQNGKILDSSLQKISRSAVKGGRLFPANSLIFSTSATIGEHALVSVPYLANQRFTNLTLKEKYTNIFVDRFLFYYGFPLADWCRNNTHQSSFASVDMDGFRRFPIPIPCPNNPKKSLSIQSEIVRILDAFTELTTELTTELNNRKKQYNYYRDKLLTFDEDFDVEWKALGEVGRFVRGNGLQKKDFTESGVGCIHYGQLYTHFGVYAEQTITYISKRLASRLRKAKKGNLVIATTSEDDEGVCKAVAWLGDAEIAVSSDAYIYEHSLNSKYVSYFFQTDNFQKQKRPHITGTKVRRVNGNSMGKILIPIPCPNNPEKSLAEQARIVSILDKFNALTTSITEGLPREIELRQKQYTYYRDLLLNFPKPDRSVTPDTPAPDGN